jgi:DNA-binding response OmpR family regulator
MRVPDVLVVDDDPDVRAMLGYALGAEFTVRFATNGVDAIEQLAINPPDAMILDLVMPGAGGYDVLEARRDRALAPHARVIVLSAKDDEQDLVRSWGLGADAHLSKPCDPEHVAATLRAHLAAAADA